MNSKKPQNHDRRKLLSLIGITGVAAGSIPASWVAPVIDSVILPAHAQTSMCVADPAAFAGGPLVGNASGATTCQASCEAEATAAGAQLCAVTESLDASNNTICGCELDPS